MPNHLVAGEPPSHIAYIEEVGQTARDMRFTAAATTPPSNPSLIEREALPAVGSATAFATTNLFTDTLSSPTPTVAARAQSFTDEPAMAGSSSNPSDGQMLLHLPLSLSPSPEASSRYI